MCVCVVCVLSGERIQASTIGSVGSETTMVVPCREQPSDPRTTRTRTCSAGVVAREYALEQALWVRVRVGGDG